jgi:uncharacterized membrane protein YgdD (TMEM256/DUF423 family)
MAETDVNIKVSGIESKFNRIALTVVAALLIFVGPTYVPYLLADALNLDYVASISVGGVFFVVGLVMLIWLIRKKVIT